MEQSDAPKGQDNTPDHRNDRQNSSAGANVIPTTPQYPPAPNEHKCSYHDAKPFWKRLATYEFIVGVAIFVVGIKVACIYSGQLDQMIEQNINSREFFQKDQRPDVWLFGAEGTKPSKDQKFMVNVYLANFGKTPALRERAMGKIFLGPDARRQGLEWLSQMKQVPLSTFDMSVAVIPPGIPSDVSKSYSFTTAESEKPLTADDVTYLNRNIGAVLVVKIEYFDAQGLAKPYVSSLCMERTPNGHMGYCHHDENDIQ